MSGRCICCDIKLFPQEIADPENEGMCNRCISESFTQYNYLDDHQYDHSYIDDGMSQAKCSDY